MLANDLTKSFIVRLPLVLFFFFFFRSSPINVICTGFNSPTHVWRLPWIAKSCYTNDICRVSQQYDYFLMTLKTANMQRVYHINYIHSVSLQYVFFYIFGDYFDMQRLYHTNFIHMASISPGCFLLCLWRLLRHAKALSHCLHS